MLCWFQKTKYCWFNLEQKEIEHKEKKRDLRLDRKAPVSPAVKTLAKDKGVDLALVKGTGKKGAILKKDVLAYLDGGSSESSTQNVSFQKSDFYGAPLS